MTCTKIRAANSQSDKRILNFYYYYSGHVAIMTLPFFSNSFQGCVPVGVGDRNRIPDARMNASTFYDDKEYPHYGRLNGTRGRGVWCAKKRNKLGEYLQVDMMKMYSVCAVATQGSRKNDLWTTNYKLYFSTDGATWETYQENRADKVSI